VEFVCERLADGHDLSGFDCGEPTLNDWLRTSARDSDGRDITRTYVFHRGDGVVVGYYAVMPYFIEREILTKKQRRGLPDRIPCYLISKLALDNFLKGQRLGSQLLASALMRAAPAAAQIGGRYVVVDALNETASSFYLHHGFEAVEGRDDRLVLRTKALETHLPPPDT
jgi:GNAT superfamily N-acetyltransferase